MKIEGVTDWVEKGPFECRLADRIYRDGSKEPFFQVRLSQPSSLWPKGGYFTEFDEEGLPVVYWRERDDDAKEFNEKDEVNANAGINWAPRGCFIWHSEGLEEHSWAFISVNMDDRVPFLLSMVFVNLVVLGFILLINIPILISGGIVAYLQSSFATLFISLLFAIPIIHIDKHILSMRHILLLRFLISRFIWSGRIEPNVQPRSWETLEAFSINNIPEVPEGYNKAKARTQIVADFGLEYPTINVMDGTWPQPVVKEFHRELTLQFIAKRKGFTTEFS